MPVAAGRPADRARAGGKISQGGKCKVIKTVSSCVVAMPHKDSKSERDHRGHKVILLFFGGVRSVFTGSGVATAKQTGHCSLNNCGLAATICSECAAMSAFIHASSDAGAGFVFVFFNPG